MFSKYEQRFFIKFQIARGKECTTMTYSIHGSLWWRLYHIVWAYAFRGGREDVHKKRGADRPQSASDVVYVNAVRALLEEHRCWTCIELAREVGIAPGTILHILKKLKMRKICARWVPENLKSKHAAENGISEIALRTLWRWRQAFLRRIITLDETWFRCHQPKFKRLSNDWRHSDSPRPKKVSTRTGST